MRHGDRLRLNARSLPGSVGEIRYRTFIEETRVIGQ
jgi:hypothetical protein